MGAFHGVKIGDYYKQLDLRSLIQIPNFEAFCETSNIDKLVKSRKAPVVVIPAKLVLDSDRGAGIQ